MASKFTTQGLSFPTQGSASFDGASDYIQLNTPFSYTNHTVAAWVYAEDDATNKYIFDNRDAFGDGIRVFSMTDEKIRYGVNSSDLTTSNSYGNQWVYIVGTYDGTTQKLYVDGSLDQSATTSQTISVSSDSKIGSQNDTIQNWMDGNLANVAIWNRALSSDEINSVMWKSYDGLTPSETSGLQAWYSLDDISGSSVPDSSGNGNNGTAY